MFFAIVVFYLFVVALVCAIAYWLFEQALQYIRSRKRK